MGLRSKLLAHPLALRALASTAGGAQRAMRAWERAQNRLLGALGMPAKEDYQRLGKALASLKRRLNDLSDRLDSD